MWGIPLTPLRFSTIRSFKKSRASSLTLIRKSPARLKAISNTTLKKPMKRLLVLLVALVLTLGGKRVADAAELLSNGNLDQTYQQEIVPGFFLPKPDLWINVGTRSISGPY